MFLIEVIMIFLIVKRKLNVIVLEYRQQHLFVYSFSFLKLLIFIKN